MTHWQRITEYIYRLDDVWTVRMVAAVPIGAWCAYRGYDRLLGRFADASEAIAEAERLREEDKNYR